MIHAQQAGRLITTLHTAKQINGEITREVVRATASELKLPVSEVFAASTFFSAFNGMTDGEPDDRFLSTPSHEKKINLMMNHPAGYAGAQKVLREKMDILVLMRQAKLRGRSGSGFPVADKWEGAIRAKGIEKYIVCNGSEGEGDTFKDYYLMVNKPEMIIEGLLICAFATNIEQGYIYVRAEYERAFKTLRKAVQEAYAQGALGSNALGSGRQFELEVILGGGAYVSGEETALLEMLEGHRSEPRIKPPFPGTCGLFNKPTIVNNVESFAAVAALALHGVDVFRRYGTEETGGTKLFTISGCIRNPGIYELPHHAMIEEALDAAGGPAEGKEIKGFQVGGGATGSFGAASQLKTILDYETMRAAGLSLGTGAIRFIDVEESIPNLALKSIAFLKDQSCGVCTACRNGLAELKTILVQLCDKGGTREMLLRAEELCGYMGQNARCALGQSAPTAFLTALNAFPEEFDALCWKEAPYEYCQLQD